LSTLTKVFIVILAVFGMFHSAMSIAIVSRMNNWKETATTYDQNAKVAETNLRNVMAAYAAESATAQDKQQALLAANGQLQQELQTLQRDKSAVESALKEAEAAKSNSEAVARSLATVLKTEQDTSAEYRGQRNKLEVRTLDLERRNIDLNSRVNELTARLAVSNEQKRQFEQQINILKTQQEAVAMRGPALESPTGAALAGVDAETPVARSAIRGKVVGTDGNILSVSVGSADGVKENMVFVVYRGDVYVGDLRISTVRPNEAAGELIQSVSPAQPGDQVTDVSTLVSRG
jgi:hypothetical protein